MMISPQARGVMNRSRTLTIATVLTLVGMLVAPMGATAATDLSVGVDQRPDTGEAVVTVVDNGTAVENATVTVTAMSAYAGNGTYETDTNGSLVLPEPNETVSVTVNASSDNSTASQQVELVPRTSSLDVSATQSDGGSTTVTVTQYDEPVENASVEVDASDGVAGNYTTDANGTVTLAQPEDDVNATIAAVSGNLSAETTVALSGAALDVTADQRDTGVVVTVTDGGTAVENATVEVESDGNYAGAGTYATGADGQVTLPLPTENVTVDVTATADNETATTTADLTVDIATETPFGLVVSNFVSALQSATVEGPPGQVISEFVTGNNPGNAGEAPGQSGAVPGNGNAGDAPGQSAAADEAPGQSGDAPGQSGDAPGRSGDNAEDGNESNEDGNPAAANGNGNGNAPADAGPGSDEDETDEEDEGTETPESDEADEADDGEREEAETDEDDDSDDSDDAEGSDDGDDAGSGSDGDGGSDSAPGNSGNAPGRN